MLSPRSLADCSSPATVGKLRSSPTRQNCGNVILMTEYYVRLKRWPSKWLKRRLAHSGMLNSQSCARQKLVSWLTSCEKTGADHRWLIGHQRTRQQSSIGPNPTTASPPSISRKTPTKSRRVFAAFQGRPTVSVRLSRRSNMTRSRRREAAFSPPMEAPRHRADGIDCWGTNGMRSKSAGRRRVLTCSRQLQSTSAVTVCYRSFAVSRLATNSKEALARAGRGCPAGQTPWIGTGKGS
jgi:hypothetical protein